MLTRARRCSPEWPIIKAVWPVPNVVPEIAVFTFDDTNLACPRPTLRSLATRALWRSRRTSIATIDTMLDVSGGDGGVISPGLHMGRRGAGGPGGFGGGDQNQPGLGPGGGGDSVRQGSSPFLEAVLDWVVMCGEGSPSGHPAVPAMEISRDCYRGAAAEVARWPAGFPPLAGWWGALGLGAAGIVTIGTNGTLLANGGTGGCHLTIRTCFGGGGSGGGVRLHGAEVMLDGSVEAARRTDPAGIFGMGGGGRVLLSGMTSFPFAVGISTVDPAAVTAGVDVRGGLDSAGNPDSQTSSRCRDHPLSLVLVPGGQSVAFGQYSVIQTATTTQPRVELI